MSFTHQRPFVVSVEGNIGSGKSTMLRYFEKMDGNVTVLAEPVTEWCDLNGINLLQKLYEDSKRRSMQFQAYVQLSRLRLLKHPSKKKIKLLERSIQNNRYCFLELAQREGSLGPSELAVLKSWYEWLDSSMGLELDLIVYLRTSPEVSYNRMCARGRSEENGIPRQFIQSLHNVYEDWLIHKTLGPIDTPVLVIDADSSKEEMIKSYESYKSKIFGTSKISLPNAM